MLLTITTNIYIYELVLRSFQSYFSNKELMEDTTNLPSEQTTIELVLCSTHFEDIVLIVPERLYDIPIGHNYQKISI